MTPLVVPVVDSVIPVVIVDPGVDVEAVVRGVPSMVDVAEIVGTPLVPEVL